MRKFKCFTNNLNDLKLSTNEEIYYDIIFKTIIERKAEADIEQSLADKRLYAQAQKLKILKDDFNMKNFVIVERSNQNSTTIFERRKLVDIQ